MTYFTALVLYIVGVFYSDSYSWISNGMPLNYERVFLTTRNGVFFGFPMMLIGKLIFKKENIPVLFIGIIIPFWLEVYYIGLLAKPGGDRCFYFFLPVTIFALFGIAKRWNPPIGTIFLRKASAAIYLMQYIMINVGQKIAGYVTNDQNVMFWITYCFVIIIPCFISFFIKDTQIGKRIF